MPTRQDGVENRDKVYGHALGFSALIQTLSKYLTCLFQEEEVEHYTQQLEDLEQQVQILEALKVRPEILTFVRIAESCCIVVLLLLYMSTECHIRGGVREGTEWIKQAATQGSAT